MTGGLGSLRAGDLGSTGLRAGPFCPCEHSLPHLQPGWRVSTGKCRLPSLCECEQGTAPLAPKPMPWTSHQQCPDKENSGLKVTRKLAYLGLGAVPKCPLAPGGYSAEPWGSEGRLLSGHSWRIKSDSQDFLSFPIPGPWVDVGELGEGQWCHQL